MLSVTINHKEYLGTGSEDEFDYTWLIDAASELEVRVNGVLKVKDIDYTLDGVGNQNGGTVTFTTAPASEAVVALRRIVDYDQQLQIQPNSALPSSSVEDQFDQLVKMIQSLDERLSRIPSFQVGTEGALRDLELPAPAANEAIVWNATEDGLTTADILGGSSFSQVSTIDSIPLASLPSAGSAGRIRHISDNEGGVYYDTGSLWVPVKDLQDVRDKGATGDGATDDRAAFVLADTNNDFTVPPGTYVIGSNLTITNNVVFTPGAILKPSSGVTITLNGTLIAGPWQIFDADETTTGSIRFAGGAPAVYPQWWKTNEDDSIDDSPAFQSACNSLTDGGTVLIPKPADKYLLDTRVDVPNNVIFQGLGAVSASDPTYPNFHYSGSDAAFALDAGESDNRSRGVEFRNISVYLTTAGATGFRFWRGRDIVGRNLMVVMGADSCIGFHFKGERDGGTNLGLFDSTFTHLRSQASNAGYTSAIHYKLTGTSNDGQVNANLFMGLRALGSGSFILVGPAQGNSFIGLDGEDMTGHFIEIEADAHDNGFRDMYTEAQAGWSSKIFLCASGTQGNYLEGYVAGQNTAYDDVTTQSGNYVRYRFGRYLRQSAGNQVLSGQLPGEAENRIEIALDAIRYSDDGATTPFDVITPQDVMQNVLTLGATVTPDLSAGYHCYLDIDAATNPTIAAPTNLPATAGTATFISMEIQNTTGAPRTLTWNAAYQDNSTLLTSLTNGKRYTVLFKKRGASWIIMGTPIEM